MNLANLSFFLTVYARKWNHKLNLPIKHCCCWEKIRLQKMRDKNALILHWYKI